MSKTSKKRAEPHVFGKVFERARKARGFSKYKVARLTNRATSQIYAIERGDNEPTIGTIIMLAEAIQMEPRELFNELYLSLKGQAAEKPMPAADRTEDKGRRDS